MQMPTTDSIANTAEIPETIHDSTGNQKQTPKFKSRGEAEAYCLKETGITIKELNIVNQTPKAYRSAMHAFYATMRKEGVKMDKISEFQRRDAFMRGYLYGLQEVGQLQTQESNDTAV